MDMTICPPKIDKSTFFSPYIPDEVRLAVPYMHEVQHETSLKLIDDILSDQSVCGKDDAFIVSYSRSCSIPTEYVGLLITAIESIVRFVIKSKASFQTITMDMKKMNIPDPIIGHFMQRIRQHRSTFENLVELYRVGFPVLRRLRWRVDVIISTGSLGRVMKPLIMLQVVFCYFSPPSVC